ncbi:MAG TPA: hypothetical protein VGL95_01950 [Acetobacteraceae bacterium]|jgi:hypothetical protein
MLDVAGANAKTTAFNAEFALIGNTGDGRMPRSKKNTEPVAWEYHVASHLLRVAEARKKKAHAAAVKLGVMFDHEKSPLAVGTEALVYAGDVVEIAVSVTTPGTKLDPVELGVALVKAGMKLAVVEKLFTQCTHDQRAPHKFTSTLATK